MKFVKCERNIIIIYMFFVHVVIYVCCALSPCHRLYVCDVRAHLCEKWKKRKKRKKSSIRRTKKMHVVHAKLADDPQRSQRWRQRQQRCSASFQLLHCGCSCCYFCCWWCYFYAKPTRRHELKPKLKPQLTSATASLLALHPLRERFMFLCWCCCWGDDEIVKRKNQSRNTILYSVYNAHNLEEVNNNNNSSKKTRRTA